MFEFDCYIFVFKHIMFTYEPGSSPVGACAMSTSKDHILDLFVIGGGINGTGIAADAAGRGLSVALCEQADLASATSSASSKLIHGGLRYLEHHEFRLVREALREREVLLAKRRTSSTPCASCCRIAHICGPPGCCGPVCSSTIISASARDSPAPGGFACRHHWA